MVSGLAAIFGVVLVAMLPQAVSAFTSAVGAVVTRPSMPSLADILDLEGHLAYIIVAAVFGLTPGLFFNRLQGLADTFSRRI